MDRAASVFEQPGEPASGSGREKELLEKIGELAQPLAIARRTPRYFLARISFVQSSTIKPLKRVKSFTLAVTRMSW